MKLIIITILLSSYISNAQKAGNGTCDDMVRHSKELKLTKKQDQQIRKITKEFWIKFEDKKYLMDSDQKSDRDIIKNMFLEFGNKLLSVLTPEQIVKWNLICEKYKDNPGHGGSNED